MKAHKLPSGKWRAQAVEYYEHLPDGTRITHRRSFTADTKVQAEYAAIKWSMENPPRSERAPEKTFSWCVEDYCSSRSNVLSPATIRGYRSMAKNSLLPIADTLVTDLDSILVQRIINDIAGRYSSKSTRNAFGLITAIVSLYAPDTTLKVHLPRKPKATYNTPSDAQITALIDHLAHTDRIMLNAVYLAAFGSLRRSEVCAAMASDITFNELHVHSAMVPVEGGGYVIKEPKTPGSDRYVILPEFVLNSFPSSGFLVPLSPTALSARWHHIMEHLNMNFKFHELRHYYVSIAHALGVPDRYIANQTGHSDPSTLNLIYKNTLSDYQRQFFDITTGHFTALCSHVCTTPQLSTSEKERISDYEGLTSSGVRGIRTE